MWQEFCISCDSGNFRFPILLYSRYLFTYSIYCFYFCVSFRHDFPAYRVVFVFWYIILQLTLMPVFQCRIWFKSSKFSSWTLTRQEKSPFEYFLYIILSINLYVTSFFLFFFIVQFRPSSAYDSPFFTTNSGAPVWNNNASLTVGSRGKWNDRMESHGLHLTSCLRKYFVFFSTFKRLFQCIAS